MINELVYTSAPQGLFPGNTGFAVVGCTRNMDYAVCKQLENLSAYTPHYPHYDANAWNNPINYAHRIVQINGIEYHILSRICFNGLDYTQRSNKLASHLAISSDELPNLPSGPACVLNQEHLFKTENWQIKTEYFEQEPIVMDLRYELSPCTTWQNITGDAGWAGVIAESYLNNPQKNIYIIFNEQHSNYNLSLVTEVLSLLPVHLRWQVTFSTYFTELPAGVTCNIRFCLPTCDSLYRAKQNPANNLIIDLTQALHPATGGELINVARTGKQPQISINQPYIEKTFEHPIPQIIQPTSIQYSTPITQPIMVQKNNNTKVISIIAFIALAILGIIFAINKNNDNRQIKALKYQSQKNKDIAIDALKSTRTGLLFRIEQIKKLTPTKKQSPILSDELQAKATVLTNEATFDNNGKLTSKSLTEIKVLVKKIDKKLSDQKQLLKELNKILTIAKQEQDLQKDLDKYNTLVNDLSLSEIPLSYTLTINAKSIKDIKNKVEEDNKKLLERKNNLPKYISNEKATSPQLLKTPAKIIQAIPINKAWSLQKTLWNTVQNNKLFTIAFNDLIPNGTIKNVYWGNNSMICDNKVYSHTLNGQKIKLKIALKNNVLCIRKEGNSKIKVNNVKFSILLNDAENNNHWINFFLDESSNISFSKTIFFTIKNGSLQFHIPILKENQMLLDKPYNLKGKININNKNIELKANNLYWELKTAPVLPRTVKKLLNTFKAIQKEQSKLQKNIESNKFSPSIEKTPDFKKYQKSPKKAEDKKELLVNLLEFYHLSELGIKNLDKEYSNKTFKESQDAIKKKIKDELNKLWAKNVTMLFESPAIKEQKIIVESFRGDK